MAQILRRIAALAALAALICLIAVPAPAEDVIDVTLAAGERWTVPADRLGSCVISDESVLRLEDGALVAVRPGRAEARMSGICARMSDMRGYSAAPVSRFVTTATKRESRRRAAS